MSWVETKFYTRIEEACDLTQAKTTDIAWFSSPDRWRLHTVWVVIKTAVTCDAVDIALDVELEGHVIGTITITDGAAIGDVFEMSWVALATLEGYTGHNWGEEMHVLPSELLVVTIHTQGDDLTTLAGTCDVYISAKTA